jgi:Zn-dependent protease with chaperone function/Zn-finger nucleic acid-binding protein
MRKPAPDFYEIQRRQKTRSLFLFAAVLLFHFTALGLIALALIWSFALVLTGQILGSPGFWSKFLAIDFGVAALVAVLHFQDARRNGARFILRRLQAVPPDPGDRYHQLYLNVVDEIRIAAGLPKVKAYVLPTFAFNSLALIEEDGSPAVAVSEGLLAEGARDEVQAVVAHELAHIARGDAFYMTLVCSLANVFEKMRETLEPEHDAPHGAGAGRTEGGGFPPVLFYVAVFLSSVVMRLLSTLISRERELLADAAAVEISRSPEALARAVYKAHVKNSFIGAFSEAYSPLFIVPPDSREISEGLMSRIFNTHPPVMKRIRTLAGMAGKSPAAVIDEIRAYEKRRDKAREVLRSGEERGTPPAAPRTAAELPDEARIWSLGLAPDKWEGPFSLGEILCHPRFTLLRPLRNAQEKIEAKAREFPQIRAALRRISEKKPLDPERHNRCPRCRIPLTETFYEGVAVRACPKCGGRLVDMAAVDKIIARKEVAFSADLQEKARRFREKVLLNPLKKQKINPDIRGAAACPACGYKMVARPYNYQYFIPVDKCLSCSRIWFDTDELEILQILIETR